MLFVPRPRGLGRENFLKLSDQEEVTGIFQGEPYLYKRHWVMNRGVECMGVGCSFCGEKEYPSFRFRMNFVVSQGTEFQVKLFEGGADTYDKLSSLDKKYDLSKTFVEISRRGVRQNTRYDILPRVDMPFSEELKDKVQGMGLLALKAP